MKNQDNIDMLPCWKFINDGDNLLLAAKNKQEAVSIFNSTNKSNKIILESDIELFENAFTMGRARIIYL